MDTKDTITTLLKDGFILVFNQNKLDIVKTAEALMKAGVKRENMFVNKPLGGHPGGTVRLGTHLDTNCRTEITNCYCVDNSIIPEPWGQPPTVTLVAMAKRLAKHLTTDTNKDT